MLRNAIAPDLQEILETGSAGEIDFYCQYARIGGGAVLVLLCGTGRVAIPIAKQGMPVIGLDTEADTIEYAKRKAQQAGAARAMFVRGDPTNFVSDNKHALVIIPGGALMRLLTLEEQIACLTAARHALQLGGKLVMDLPLLDPGASLSDQPQVRRLGDRTAVVQRHRRYDPALQVVEDLIDCRWLDREGQVERTQCVGLSTRYATPGEIELLLNKAGFAADFYGGFDQQALMPGAARLVVEAQRR